MRVSIPRHVRYYLNSWKSCWFLARNNILVLDSKESDLNFEIYKVEPNFDLNDGFSINPTITRNGDLTEFFFRKTNLSVRPNADKFGNMEKIQVGSIIKNALYKGILINKNELSEVELVIPEDAQVALEDVRVITFGNQDLLIGTQVRTEFQDSQAKWRTRVAIQIGDQNYLLESPVGKNYEKNWVPVSVKNGCLTMLHSNNPTRLVFFDLKDKTQTSEVLADIQTSIPVSGGSQFVALPDLNFVRVARRRFPLFHRGYVHVSFIVMNNSEYLECAISTPFIFKDFGFEICNGLQLDQNDNFIFSWAENDSMMYLGYCSRIKLLEWLKRNQLTKNQNSNFLSVLKKMVSIKKSI